MSRIILFLIAFFQITSSSFGQDDKRSTVFDYYPWLLESVDTSSCEVESIMVHGELGGSSLIVVRAETGNTIFNERGDVYCRDHANLDCLAFYRLSAPVLEWECEESEGEKPTDICDTPLTRDEIITTLLNGQTERAYGVVVYEYYSEAGGYFYEVRNQCAFEFMFVGGFTHYAGAYWTCSGAFICNYGGDVPMPCDPQFNYLGFDLSLATTRKLVFQSDCSAYSESIIACSGDTIELISKSGPSGPFVAGINIEACEFSGQIINTDDYIDQTEQGFVIVPNESFRYVITDQPNSEDCASNQYVVNVIIDDTCDVGPTDEPAIFSEYPFLEDLVDYSSCEGETISEWADFNDNRYLYITATDGTSTLYNSEGLLYCKDSPSLSCIATYANEQLNTWSCGEVQPQDTFAVICPGEPLPFLQAPYQLRDFVGPCGPSGPVGGPPQICPCPNIGAVSIQPKEGVVSDLIDGQYFEVAPTTTTTYTLTSTTGPPAPDSPCRSQSFTSSYTIIVKQADECETDPCICTQEAFPVCGTDGKTYVNACYAACEGVEVAFNGTCEERECLQNRGSILLQECDDGTPFVFIRLADGEIIDPYFPDSLNVEFNDRTMISFGYVEAAFETPCSQASKAVIITCFLLIPDCACDDIYDPVCGVDGVTYSSRCVAECLGFDILNEGECDPVNVCDSFNGRILLENCSDGTPFVFIELENGDIIDPYFPEDLEFDYFDGQFVRFDGVDADFDTPCDQATKAVNISCIDEIIPDCACTAEYDPVCGINGQVYSNSCVADCAGVEVAFLGECGFGEADCLANSGIIRLENCDDGASYWFIELSNGDILDPYVTSNISFEYFDGQNVTFDYRNALFDTPCSQAKKAVYITCIVEDVPDGGTSSEIFSNYQWLSDIIDPNDCDGGSSIEVYEFETYAFILVNHSDGGRTMYLNDGTFYCEDAQNYSCKELYNLDEASSFWNCGNNSNSSNFLNEVSINCVGDTAFILEPYNVMNQAIPCPQGPIGVESLPCPCSKVGNISISPESNAIQINEGAAEYKLFPTETTTYTITVSTVGAHTEDFCIADEFDLIYRVTVLNEGCNLQDDLNSFVRKDQTSGITILPNPTDGLFYVDYSLQEDESIESLDVINTQGQIIYTERKLINSKGHQIDLSTETPGIYFVRMWTNQSILTERVVVN